MILQPVLPWGSKRTSLLEENDIKVNGSGARKPIIQKNRSGRVVTQKSDTVYMGMPISAWNKPTSPICSSHAAERDEPKASGGLEEEQASHSDVSHKTPQIGQNCSMSKNKKKRNFQIRPACKASKRKLHKLRQQVKLRKTESNGDLASEAGSSSGSSTGSSYGNSTSNGFRSNNDNVNTVSLSWSLINVIHTSKPCTFSTEHLKLSRTFLPNFNSFLSVYFFWGNIKKKVWKIAFKKKLFQLHIFLTFQTLSKNPMSYPWKTCSLKL